MATFLMAAGVLCKHNDYFLIIKRPENMHAAGTLSFLGGGVEFEDGKNEQDILQEAARRKVFEEVGIQLEDPLTYLTASYFIDDFGNATIFVIYFCELKKSKIELNVLKKEVPEYYWMTAKQICEDKKSPDWLVRYVKLAQKIAV